VSLSFKVLGSALCLAGLCAVAPAQTPVSFSTSTQPLTTSGYTDVSNTFAVDLNNDGVPDMVIPLTPNFTTELSAGLSNGDGTFQPQRVIPISSSPIPEGTLFDGDFNNDGKADIGMLSPKHCLLVGDAVRIVVDPAVISGDDTRVSFESNR
jgi:hypothetical protein